MSNAEITGIASLQLEIVRLKAEKLRQKMVLNQNFKDLTKHIFDPVTIVKDVISHQLVGKRDLLDFAKLAVNMGINFIIERKFGKPKTFKEFLTTLAIAFASTNFFDKNISGIASRISTLINQPTNEKID